MVLVFSWMGLLLWMLLTLTLIYVFSYFTSFDESLKDVILWHVKTYHIGQQRMQRLAKEGLLSNLNKVDLNKVEMSTCEYCLIEKYLENHLEKERDLNIIVGQVCGFLIHNVFNS